MTTFADLGLSENTLVALEKKGFVEPTPIQAQTIPLLLAGDSDIVGQAATGTGKTAAFGLPIIDSVEPGQKRVQAIILTPTRELAVQVAEEMDSLAGGRRLNIATVYGGQSYEIQLRALRRGADVVVGTPGRVMDHLDRGTLKIDDLGWFVLDEADEMCAMGFIDDVRTILSAAGGGDRRTLLFSATMPREVLSVAKDFMGDYHKVQVKPRKEDAPLTTQVFHEVADKDRFEALCRVIDARFDFYGLVFCRTKADTASIAGMLADRGYPAEAIHGDLAQSQREIILDRFRKRRINILVATDVAARGIDVPDLTHVVNFSMPQSPDTYIHRVGRTGRAGKEGVAVTLIAPYEFRKFRFLTKAARVDVKKQPLPRVKDVIASKKELIMEQIREQLAQGSYGPYEALAMDLIMEADPVHAIAAVLANAHGAELDPRSYPEIKDPFRSQSTPSHLVRLKAAVGRNHGMTPRKFVDMLSRRSGVHMFKIQNVQVKHRYSTFTAPHREAKAIINALKKDGRNLVVNA